MVNRVEMQSTEWAEEIIAKNMDRCVAAALRAPYNIGGIRLDNLGGVYECYRGKNESDENYRPRLLSVMKGKLGAVME